MTEQSGSPPFDPDAWHDQALWGLAFRGGSGHLGDWTSELILDIDRILGVRWEGEEVVHRVAPARLTFEDVCGLRIDLDWPAANDGMDPPLIHLVERAPAVHGCDVPCYAFTIRFELGTTGTITFRASGFREEILTESLEVRERWILSVAERKALLGG
jgi:hypothetical protein